MYSIFMRDGDWRKFIKKAPVTSFIIVVNIIFLIITLIYSRFTFYYLDLIDLGGITQNVPQTGEWWRIITAAFLHGGILHFLSNTIIGLLALSSALERLIGSKKFSIVYFGSLILAGLAVVFFSDAIVTIGASGAIFGALGSLLYLTIYRQDLLSRQDVQSIRSLIGINILFTFLAGGISISGHLGGIIAGFLISYLIIPRNRRVVYERHNTFTVDVDPLDVHDDEDDNDRYYYS